MQTNGFKILQWGFVGSAFIGVGLLFIWFFTNLNTEGTSLGIDMIFYAFRGGDIHYDVVNGLRNPPWSVLPLIPLGFLPDRAAWGLLVYFTLVVLVLSVPQSRKRWLYWLSVLLLVVSFPSLRNFADANLEGLIIAGELLLLAGFSRQNPYILAAGVLLASAKPQAATLLLGVTALYVLQTWPREKWLKALGAVLVVVVPTYIWRGQEWLAAVRGTYQAGSIIDISLTAALERAGVASPLLIYTPVVLLVILTLVVALRSHRTLSREKAGMLIAAMLLTAPYAAGNSVLNVLAVGIIPLFMTRPVMGLVLIAMINSAFFWPREILFYYQSYWWTLVLLLTWAITGRRIYQQEIRTQPGKEAPIAVTANLRPESGQSG